MEPSSAVPVVPPPRRGWFARNWRWFVPALVLLSLLFCCGSPLLFFSGLKRNEPYQAALKAVREDERVTERIGQPIEESGVSRWVPSGSMHIENGRGEAHWDFDVAGPKGTAHVRSQSRRVAGKWQQVLLEVTFEDGKKVRLEDAQADEAPKFGGPSGEAPKFTPPPAEAPKKTDPTVPGTDIKVEIPM